MKRVLRFAIIAGLVGSAWAAGRAQANQGDSVIDIESPGGARLLCVRGCGLVGGRDIGIRAPKPDYTYSCSAIKPCKATVHGFIQK